MSSGADKNLENDEPLFSSSSSSDEEQEEDERERGSGGQAEATSQTLSPERKLVNTRKRPATGHTPLDLAKCRKVRHTEQIQGAFNPIPDMRILEWTVCTAI